MHTATSLEHICEVITNPLGSKEEEEEEGGEEAGLKRQVLHSIPLRKINRILVQE
jgi:hypothetical protein